MDPMECITFLLILFGIYWIIVMWRSLQKSWRWFRKPLCFWSDNKLWQCVYQWFIMGVISLDYVFLYCKFIWYRPGPSKGSQMVSKGCQFTMFLESTWHPFEDVGILRWVGGHLEFLGNTYNFGDWTNFGDLFLFWFVSFLATYRKPFLIILGTYFEISVQKGKLGNIWGHIPGSSEGTVTGAYYPDDDATKCGANLGANNLLSWSVGKSHKLPW